MHPIKHDPSRPNKYCGPAALSILTGIDTGQAAAVLRLVGGRERIRGAFYYEMTRALDRLGYKPVVEALPHRMTFGQWARLPRPADAIYLIESGHHYRVVQGQQVCCSLVQKPVALADDQRLQRRINAVWRIEAVAPVAIETLLPPRKPQPRAEVNRLLRELNAKLEFERDIGAYYLTTGLLLDGQDPWYGDHYVYSLDEARSRLLELRQTVGQRAASGMFAK